MQKSFCCKTGKLGKLMDIGSHRIEHEFNLVHITKQLRNLKIILKEQKLINEEMKLLVKNQGKNVIELSSDCSDNESDYSNLSEMREKLVS